MIHWIICGISILASGILVHKHFSVKLSQPVIWSALFLKIIAGIILGLIYYKYYQYGDTIIYFDLALKLSSKPLSEHWEALIHTTHLGLASQPRVEFFIRLLSVFTRLAGGSYWISSCYLSLLSFFSSIYIVSTLIDVFPKLKIISIASFLFVPTVIFWSSGITKDTIGFVAFSIGVGFLLKTYKTGKFYPLDSLFSLISIVALFKIRHYLLVSWLIFFGLLSIGFLFKSGNKKWSVAIAVVVLSGVAFLTQHIHPYLSINRIPLTLYENNREIIRKTRPANRIDLELTAPTWQEVFIHVPKAAYYGLFKPNLTDSTIIWGWLHRVENFILLVLAIFSMLLAIVNRSSVDWVIWSGLGAILLLASMLALSTPNFGSLVRYKSIIVPYLFLIFSILPLQHLFDGTKQKSNG